MGKILIFVILAVTIPRWALTLQQVDTFSLAGIPIAAIGEAIVLELGNFYLLRVYNKCRARALKYSTEWEALDERNQEQGKTTRKAKRDPVTAGHGILPITLLILEGLTVIAQTPFIAGSLLDRSAADLLIEVHQLVVIVYAFFLVISPGLMTVAIGFGIHYEEALNEAQKDRGEEDSWSLKSVFRALVCRLTGQAAPPPVQSREDRKRAEALEKQAIEDFAREKTQGGRVVSTDTAREVMLRDGYHCYHCGADLSDKPQGEIHIDHFIPRSEGGTDSKFNLTVSCHSCNGSKHAKMPKTSAIRDFQIHLINKSDLASREKIWLMNHYGLATKQRDIADSLGVSPSYVSSSLSEKPSELPESLTSFCEELTSLGGSLISASESPGEPESELGETTEAIATRLNSVRTRLHQERQNGREDDHFFLSDVKEWLDLSDVRARNVIRYGLEHGVLENARVMGLPGFSYTFTN